MFCNSDEFSDDADAPGLWTTLGVARYKEHFQSFKSHVPQMSLTRAWIRCARCQKQRSEGLAVVGVQQILFLSKPWTLGILSC